MEPNRSVERISTADGRLEFELCIGVKRTKERQELLKAFGGRRKLKRLGLDLIIDDLGSESTQWRAFERTMQEAVMEG